MVNFQSKLGSDNKPHLTLPRLNAPITYPGPDGNLDLTHTIAPFHNLSYQ